MLLQGSLHETLGVIGGLQGQRLMMMGSADAIPVAPEQAPVFVEDLPEEDQEGALEVRIWFSNLLFSPINTPIWLWGVCRMNPYASISKHHDPLS